jgi:hypothetical protein
VLPVREPIDCGKRVLSVLKADAAVKPYRPLTEHEQDLLRGRCLENDPIIIEALNILEGRVVG